MSSYDEDERPSWREIDRRRDRSRHIRQERPEKKEKAPDRWKTARVKEALERLLKGEKGTIEHDKYHRKIHETYGTEKFLSAVKIYMEKYGPPDSLSTLLLILDAKDEEVVKRAIEKGKEIYESLKEREKEDFKRKLKILSFTTKSKEIKSMIKEILYL